MFTEETRYDPLQLLCYTQTHTQAQAELGQGGVGGVRRVVIKGRSERAGVRGVVFSASDDNLGHITSEIETKWSRELGHTDRHTH